MGFNKLQQVALMVVFGVIGSISVLTLNSQATARTVTMSPVDIAPCNPTIERLAKPFVAKRLEAPLDGSIVALANEAAPKVLELYRTNSLRTNTDYYKAALVLGHTDRTDSILLGSELAIAALAKGSPQAAALAAWTHDRALVAMGRRQRFGTLFSSHDGVVRPLPIDSGVTDLHRSALGLPTVFEARRGIESVASKRLASS